MPQRHNPEQSLCRETGVAVDGVRTSRVTFCTARGTQTLPGEGKLFSLCLDSFAPHSSRAWSMCMANGAAICHLFPSLSCPTAGFQAVAWPGSLGMRENMLTLQYWEWWAHGSMEIAGASALSAMQNPASLQGIWQACGHLLDCGTMDGTSLSTLNQYTYW